MWEAMVAEMRATQADLDNRRHFTPKKEPIKDVRTVLDEHTAPEPEPEIRQAVTVTSLASAAGDGAIEVG